MFCGTDPFPELFRAKKYKINDRFLTREEFHHIMRNLPVPVTEEDIEEMFNYADKDKDNKISYKEFQIMINPPKPPEPPKPSIKDLRVRPMIKPPPQIINTNMETKSSAMITEPVKSSVVTSSVSSCTTTLTTTTSNSAVAAVSSATVTTTVTITTNANTNPVTPKLNDVKTEAKETAVPNVTSTAV